MEIHDHEHGPCWRVMETGHPSTWAVTRVVEIGLKSNTQHTHIFLSALSVITEHLLVQVLKLITEAFEWDLYYRTFTRPLTTAAVNKNNAPESSKGLFTHAVIFSKDVFKAPLTVVCRKNVQVLVAKKAHFSPSSLLSYLVCWTLPLNWPNNIL